MIVLALPLRTTSKILTKVERLDIVVMEQSAAPHIQRGELDFVVCGVARSGTTALAQYLNCFRGIICGPEYFNIEFDHTKVRTPSDFIGDRYKKNPYGLKVIEQSFNLDDGQHVVFGNKIPHYFYVLDRVLASIRGNRVIVSIRDPQACARSFNKRADNSKDDWPIGRRGFFAPLDFVYCLGALRRQRGARFHAVHHQALIFDPFEALDELVTFLVPNQRLELDVQQIGLVSRRWTVAKERSPGAFGDLESEAVRLSRAGELYEAVAARKISEPSDLSDLDPLLNEVLPTLPKIAEALTAKDGREETSSYLNQRWKRHVGLELCRGID